MNKGIETSPLVSVILPTYNRARFLQKSIGSVINQAFIDWELIIWDDGSTDNTSEVVASFNDGRIKYFCEDNHGAAYARNRAIEKSQGKLLAFLDSDDEWRANKLAEQIEVMQTHPEIDVLFTDFDNINEESRQTSRTFEQYARIMKSLLVEKLEQGIFIIHQGLLQGIADDNFIATDTVILRREVFKRTGGFNESLRNSMDFELWWRLGLMNISFAYLDTVSMTRYKPAGSLSSISVLSLQNRLHALDICTAEAIAAGQPELADFLKPQYRNAWQNQISACAMENDKKGMVAAFKNSLKYGFRPGSVRLLIQGLLHTGGHR